MSTISSYKDEAACLKSGNLLLIIGDEPILPHAAFNIEFDIESMPFQFPLPITPSELCTFVVADVASWTWFFEVPPRLSLEAVLALMEL